MAKTDTTTQPFDVLTDILKSGQSVMSWTPAVAPQVTHFWDMQEKLLNEFETYNRHWFERRHEATRSAMGVARTVASAKGGDPAAAMEAVTDWQRHSMERVADDMREWFEMVSRCAGQMTEDEIEAVEETVEETTKAVKQASKSSESMPV